MKFWTAAALAASLVALGGCKPESAQPKLDPDSLTVQGVVADGELKDLKIWFDLTGMDLRFVFKVDEQAIADPIFARLKESNGKGTAVVVRFALDDAFIERHSRRPTFAVKEIVVAGRELTGVRPYKSVRALETLDIEDTMARGVALYHAGRYAEARDKLNRCIAGRGLAYDLKALAHKYRGYAYADEIELRESAPNDAGDKQLLKALADFKAWAAIEPDNPQAARAIADMLTLLGAYDQALAEFASIAQRWPKQRYRAAVRVGAIYRQLGDHGSALRALDDLVKAEGPQDGMMFHYHRGWTLIQLSRYDEAVTELTRGLEDQPDYEWALIRRACALGQLGRIGEALGDQTKALQLLHEAPDDLHKSDSVKANIARAEIVAAELGIAAAGPAAKTSIACDGYPELDSHKPRKRSKWLTK